MYFKTLRIQVICYKKLANTLLFNPQMTHKEKPEAAG